VELLYSLEPAHWGRGLATEAAARLLDHGFGTLGLARIIARADTPNLASQRVMQRLGMRFERDMELNGLPHVQYTLDAETWRRDRASGR
jgi:RimJ/RimL family protein N-acetyltransferase